MTVRDLYNWCKAYRYKDAKVYMVGDSFTEGIHEN